MPAALHNTPLGRRAAPRAATRLRQVAARLLTYQKSMRCAHWLTILNPSLDSTEEHDR